SPSKTPGHLVEELPGTPTERTVGGLQQQLPATPSSNICSVLSDVEERSPEAPVRARTTEGSPLRPARGQSPWRPVSMATNGTEAHGPLEKIDAEDVIQNPSRRLLYSESQVSIS